MPRSPLPEPFAEWTKAQNAILQMSAMARVRSAKLFEMKRSRNWGSTKEQLRSFEERILRKTPGSSQIQDMQICYTFALSPSRGFSIVLYGGLEFSLMITGAENPARTVCGTIAG